VQRIVTVRSLLGLRVAAPDHFTAAMQQSYREFRFKLPIPAIVSESDSRGLKSVPLRGDGGVSVLECSETGVAVANWRISIWLWSKRSRRLPRATIRPWRIWPCVARCARPTSISPKRAAWESDVIYLPGIGTGVRSRWKWASPPCKPLRGDTFSRPWSISVRVKKRTWRRRASAPRSRIWPG